MNTTDEIKFSIKFKFLVAIFSIILFISITLIFYFVTMSKRELLKEIEKRGMTEAKNLANDAKYGVFTENKSILDDIIVNRIEEPDIAYIEIAREDGLVLSMMMKKEDVLLSHRDDRDEALKLELGDSVYRSSIKLVNGENVYEFIAPIVEEQGSEKGEFKDMTFFDEKYSEQSSLTSIIGNVKVGILLKDMEERLAEIIYVSVVIILLVIIVAIIISLIFINIIVKPIRQVTQAAIEISSGDLTKIVDVKSTDEVGVLAKHFNMMTTSLRNTIDELGDLKNGLENEVEKRTVDLKQANIELEEAYEKVSELEQVKTNFVSTVSHELRTPLTSILGFATTTLKYYEKDILPLVPMVDKKVKRRAIRIKQNLSIVVSEGERLTRLINDVLDIAKMEAGKTEWDIKELDIIEVCRQALSAVSGYPKSDRVDVRFDSPGNVRSIKGDPDRLVQVIVNFMSNALKFTKQGNVTLSVEARGKDVKVMVSDSGKGISNEGLGKVFEKFTQVDEVDEGKPKGTGLGLPICKGIIEHLGGEIWVESEVGKGSRFCFTINYCAVENEKPADSVTRIEKRVVEDVRQKAAIDTEIDTENKKPNVLIVDDNPNIRELLHQELELENYNVLEAKDGAEALKIVKNSDNHIDLILLDIMMPDVDGFDVLSSIKANEKLAHIPVIIISAYDYKQKMYRLGAEGFITKPIDQTKLLSDMSALLNGVSGKKALLIDSDDNIEGIRPFLKEKGYIVNSANNGEDGLKKARDEKPDIIMLGLETPDIKKGLEIIKKHHKSKDHIHMILFGRRMEKEARRIAETINVEIIELNDMQKLLENG